MIVVDTNVLAYSLIQGDRTALAQEVRTRDPDWVVPTLWRHEFLNVLSFYVRRGGVPEAEAVKLYENAARLLATAEHPVDMVSALSLAIRHSISAYDAQYVELARALGVPLVTEDVELLMKLPNLAVSMANFSGGKGKQ